VNAPAPRMRPLHRWPLIAQPSNRGESVLTDARLVNAFGEKDPNTGEYWVQKRIGYSLDYNIIPGGATQGNGIFYFKTAQVGGFGSLAGAFAVLTNGAHASIYNDGVVFGTPNGLDPQASGWKYYFQPTPSTLVFASDGTMYYTSSSSAYATPTLPGTRGSFIRGLAYLDQTVYFMDEKGQIFGSALDNPASWTTTNKVIANAIPGEAIILTQQLNYVIALKENSMEVFYDANNPPPGSPLSPLAGALSNYGALKGTAQTIDDILIFATANRTVSPQIVRVDNLQITPISPPPIERILDPLLTQNPTVLYSWTFKHGGHRFYGITYQGSGLDITSPRFTLVYDIDQNLWYQWSSPGDTLWRVTGMAYDSNSRHVLQGIYDGSVYFFEGDYEFPTDNGVVAPVHIYTPNVDFGTRNRKILNKMYFNSDQQTGSYLYVSRSDDDYQHWSIPRRVDMGKRRPELRDEGTFTRRAYHFAHMSPTPFRIRSVDLSMSIGVS